MAQRYLNAIFFDAAKRPYKYHNIKDCQYKRNKFKAFARSLGGQYINWYDKATRQFIGREYVN